MTKSKTLDQLILLFTAIVVIIGLMWLVTFLDAHGVSERIGFFIIVNIVLLIFILTWQGYCFFRRTPRFWRFHAGWVLVHVIVSAVWAHSGNRVELCALTAPLEIYLYLRVGRYRFVRALQHSAATSVEGTLV